MSFSVSNLHNFSIFVLRICTLSLVETSISLLLLYSDSTLRYKARWIKSTFIPLSPGMRIISFEIIIGVVQSKREKTSNKSKHNKSNLQILKKFEVAFIINVIKFFCVFVLLPIRHPNYKSSSLIISSTLFSLNSIPLKVDALFLSPWSALSFTLIACSGVTNSSVNLSSAS